MTLDPSVRAVVQSYSAIVEQAAPGLVQGLYLSGSVALEDFRPGVSDIDFVAVIADDVELASGAALEALEAAHGRLRRAHRRPFFDGSYLRRADLARDPELAPPGPRVHMHRFEPASKEEHHPVTWHTLAQHGIPQFGPTLTTGEVWTDRARLSEWVLGNLDDYWRGWRDASGPVLSYKGVMSLSGWGASWAALGVSRMLHTLRTGEIVSKYAAGEHALGFLPEGCHRIVREALRLRAGGGGRSLYPSAVARRRDLLAFLDVALDSVAGLPRTAAPGEHRRH